MLHITQCDDRIQYLGCLLWVCGYWHSFTSIWYAACTASELSNWTTSVGSSSFVAVSRRSLVRSTSRSLPGSRARTTNLTDGSGTALMTSQIVIIFPSIG